jgi:hypothetical protein
LATIASRPAPMQNLRDTLYSASGLGCVVVLAVDCTPARAHPAPSSHRYDGVSPPTRESHHPIPGDVLRSEVSWCSLRSAAVEGAAPGPSGALGSAHRHAREDMPCHRGGNSLPTPSCGAGSAWRTPPIPGWMAHDIQ